MTISAVDLFCGAGGLTCGLEQAGINVISGVDLDTECKWAYEENTKAKFIEGDIGNLTADDVNSFFTKGSVRLLAGCAPCQPFSSYGRTRQSADDRWSLLNDFTRLVESCTPELVTMENVPGLIEHSIFSEFVSSLKNKGYFVDFRVLKCEQYGLPQTRRRLILIASRLGEIKIPEPTHKKPNTVKNTIHQLPKIELKKAHTSDRFHVSAGMSKLNIQRIKASKQGGTWRDWPKELVADCHNSSTGKSYPSVYGRMSWDKPSPTITTQCFGFGNGRFGHPEQNRAISLREAALLQSFPDTWQFIPKDKSIKMTSVGRMIGNAVPPLLGKIIGDCFTQHIENFQTNSKSF